MLGRRRVGIVALVVFLLGMSRLLFPWVLGFAIAALLIASIFILVQAGRPVIRIRNIPVPIFSSPLSLFLCLFPVHASVVSTDGF